MKFDPGLTGKQKKNIVLLGLILLALTASFYIKEYLRDSYITGKDGEVLGIIRKNGDQNIPLRLKVVQEGREREQEIILHFSENRNKRPEVKEKTPGPDLDTQVRHVVRSIEESENKKISLPQRGDEGAEFHWSKGKNFKPLLLLALYPMAAYALYRSDREKENKKRKIYVRRVRREIPQFNSQLLLLLNSGLIFSDAYEKIAAGYRKYDADKSPLKKIIVEVSDESRTGEKSLVTVFDDHCRKIGIRELSRLSSIILNHQRKGSDLREKLQWENEILWNGRKKDAETQGKMGETKLSFPLAILLVVLIMITASPAILEM